MPAETMASFPSRANCIMSSWTCLRIQSDPAWICRFIQRDPVWICRLSKDTPPPKAMVLFEHVYIVVVAFVSKIKMLRCIFYFIL